MGACRGGACVVAAAATVGGWLSVVPASAAPVDVLAYPMGGNQSTLRDPVHGAVGTGIGGMAGKFVVFDSNANPGPAYPSAPVLAVDPIAMRADATGAFAAGEYMRFTLTVGSAVRDMSLAGIRFAAARGTGQFDRGFAVRVDTPTTVDEMVRGSTVVPAVRNALAPFATDLSGVASLQHLSAGQTVTFEIAVFTNMPGVQTLDLDDLIVSAVVAPEPAGCSLALAAAVVPLAGRTRRRRPSRDTAAAAPADPP